MLKINIKINIRILYITVFTLIIFSFLFSFVSCKEDSQIPAEITKYASDWPTANQDYSNARSAVNSKIDLSNISELGLFWSFSINGVSEWGAAATNPLILGDTIYFQDLKSNVYAVDFKTGQQIWMKEYNMDIAGPAGVSIGYGKIFAQKGRYEVMALDMKGNEI